MYWIGIDWDGAFPPFMHKPALASDENPSNIQDVTRKCLIYAMILFVNGCKWATRAKLNSPAEFLAAHFRVVRILCQRNGLWPWRSNKAVTGSNQWVFGTCTRLVQVWVSNCSTKIEMSMSNRNLCQCTIDFLPSWMCMFIWPLL